MIAISSLFIHFICITPGKSYAPASSIMRKKSAAEFPQRIVLPFSFPISFVAVYGTPNNQYHKGNRDQRHHDAGHSASGLPGLNGQECEERYQQPAKEGENSGFDTGFQTLALHCRIQRHFKQQAKNELQQYIHEDFLIAL